MNTRQTQTLNLVAANANATSGELGTLFAMTYGSVAPNVGVETPHKRLVELERLGYVSRLASRKCTISGRTAATWAITPEGLVENLFDLLNGKV